MTKLTLSSKVTGFVASILCIGVGILLSVVACRLTSAAFHAVRLDRAASPDWHPVAAEVTSAGVSHDMTGSKLTRHGFKAWFTYSYLTNGFEYEKTCDSDHFPFRKNYVIARSEALRVLGNTRKVILSDTPPEPYSRTGGFLVKPAQGQSVRTTVYIQRNNPECASTQRRPSLEMALGLRVVTIICFLFALAFFILGLYIGCGLLWPAQQNKQSPLMSGTSGTTGSPVHTGVNIEKMDRCGHAGDGSLPAMRSAHGSPHFWDAFDRFSKTLAGNPVVIKINPVYWDRESPGKPLSFGFQLVLKPPCILQDGRSYNALVDALPREFEGLTVTHSMPWMDDSIPDPGSHC